MGNAVHFLSTALMRCIAHVVLGTLATIQHKDGIIEIIEILTLNSLKRA